MAKKNYDFEILCLQIGVGDFMKVYFEDHKHNGRFTKRSRKSDAH